jgi:hypothetical protein
VNAVLNKANARSMHMRLAGTAVLAAMLLAACGGGSGSGSNGVVPPASQGPGATGTGTSTGGAAPSAPGASGAAAPTLREQIAALERSGAYPTLDRSADIAGPDANNNGVRDDIEAWIGSQPLNDAQKKALMQDARATQRTLLVDLTDKAALQKAGEGFGASFNCGMTQFAEYSDFSKLAGKIEAMTANTRQRAERYMKYNAARSGSSTTSPNGNTCEP